MCSLLFCCCDRRRMQQMGRLRPISRIPPQNPKISNKKKLEDLSLQLRIFRWFLLSLSSIKTPYPKMKISIDQATQVKQARNINKENGVFDKMYIRHTTKILLCSYPLSQIEKLRTWTNVRHFLSLNRFFEIFEMWTINRGKSVFVLEEGFDRSNGLFRTASCAGEMDPQDGSGELSNREPKIAQILPNFTR